MRIVIYFFDGTKSHTYATTNAYTVTITASTVNCNFTSFYCFNSQLTNLDVRGCSHLYQLGCSNNQLTSLDLTGCSSLWHLACSYNLLTSLNLTDCSALQSLDCRNNQLQLSNLYVISELLLKNDPHEPLTIHDVYLYPQYLPLQTVSIRESRFSDQSVFNGSYTNYGVNRNGSYATYNSDYTVANGTITFNTGSHYNGVIDYLQPEFVEYSGIAAEPEARYYSPREINLYKVEKMRFPSKADKSKIIYNSHITIENIPVEAYEYVVNGKSAIEWIMERYAITTHKESGIENNPNDWALEMGNPRYILDLLLSIIDVSMQTVEIVKGLPEVTFE